MSDFVSHPLLVPDAVASRAYQETLARKALEKSSLIVLPTGLGKTIIALLVLVGRLTGGRARRCSCCRRPSRWSSSTPRSSAR